MNLGALYPSSNHFQGESPLGDVKETIMSYDFYKHFKKKPSEMDEVEKAHVMQEINESIRTGRVSPHIQANPYLMALYGETLKEQAAAKVEKAMASEQSIREKEMAKAEERIRKQLEKEESSSLIG